MLDNKVSIYIPTTSYNIEADTSENLNDTCILLSSLFGGCTVIESKGYYKADSGELIIEKVYIAYAYTDNLTLQSELETIKFYCRKLKYLLNQESIALEVNNTLDFI